MEQITKIGRQSAEKPKERRETENISSLSRVFTSAIATSNARYSYETAGKWIGLTATIHSLVASAFT
jgi:hypothetical protein